MDQNNIIDAENTRNDVYAHLKSEIDQAKASIQFITITSNNCQELLRNII